MKIPTTITVNAKCRRDVQNASTDIQRQGCKVIAETFDIHSNTGTITYVGVLKGNQRA